MRMFVTIMMVAAIAGCGKTRSTAQVASAPATGEELQLKWTIDGEQHAVMPIEMDFDDTEIALDTMFDVYSGDEPVGLCYQGDINQVCSLLSKMSKLSRKYYEQGEHGFAALKGCRIQGHAQVVDANFELVNDYAEAPYTPHLTIEACAPAAAQ